MKKPKVTNLSRPPCRVSHIVHEIIFTTVFLLVVIILPMLFFWYMENTQQTWTVTEALYYVIVTVTTVGFGDYREFRNAMDVIYSTFISLSYR